MTLPTREDLARLSVLRALSAYDGKARTGPLPDVLNSASLNQLSHSRIIDGVIAFCLAAGVGSGSAGSKDFYKLLNAYVHDPGFEAEVNRLLIGYKIKH